MTAPLKNLLNILRISTGINKSPRCLIGKTALITGASEGIGYYTCLSLASRGCKIIMADKEKLDQVKENIIYETGNENITALHLNLASFDSIRKFAKAVNETTSSLDILIHNAGIPGSNTAITEDGLNTIMQVNYFGPFLLTHLLLKVLHQAAPSRIIFVSSNTAYVSNLSEQTITMLSPTTAVEEFLLYANSKMALILVCDIFASELQQFCITANSLHPGWVQTRLFDRERTVVGSQFLGLLAKCVAALFGKTPWEGCQTAVYLSMDKNVENTTGQHFWDCQKFFKPPKAKDIKLAKILWEISEKCVKLSDDEKISQLLKSRDRFLHEDSVERARASN